MENTGACAYKIFSKNTFSEIHLLKILFSSVSSDITKARRLTHYFSLRFTIGAQR